MVAMVPRLLLRPSCCLLLVLFYFSPSGCIGDYDDFAGAVDVHKDQLADAGRSDKRGGDGTMEIFHPDLVQSDKSLLDLIAPLDANGSEVKDAGKDGNDGGDADATDHLDSGDGVDGQQVECGDGSCNPDEACESCPEDCGECPKCGDAKCVPTENCESCLGDCPCEDGDICWQQACCTVACEDKECGEDGCGGSCGECLDGFECAENQCLPIAQFGEACDDNADCSSGYCVEAWMGKVCTTTCIQECPGDGWHCSLVAKSCPDCLYICMPQFVHLCQPCKGNNDCGGELVETEDRCVDYGSFGQFCGGECYFDSDCPDEYVCQDIELEGEVLGQCVHESGLCACNELSVTKGLATACYTQNEYGICYGERFCAPTGLSDCDAKIPMAEQCNGVDDDCDLLVDEDLLGIGCQVANAFGTCQGYELCQDGEQTCDAPQAAAEACNGLDDDCDGKTDEVFADSDGDGLADCQEEDDDGDSFKDWEDNCDKLYNPDQKDFDSDSIGDLCDPDDDNDLSKDMDDCDPYDPDAYPGNQEKCDGTDNDCDGDRDEGYPDFDLDGWADCVDVDDDNDGTDDGFDNCPTVFNPEQLNSDGFPDGGDECDQDDDNDGILDSNDNCPTDYNPLQTDSDGDAVGNACQGDKDGDGIADDLDNCPVVFNPGQPDNDHDLMGDACDDDDDADGELDLTDCEPLDPSINHYAFEVCDGLDNNCDSQIDGTGAIGCQDYYLDQDGDDWGVSASKCQCGPDGLFTADNFGDCDDLDPTVSPGQKEDCSTGKDENCNGSDNDQDALQCIMYYEDQDGDSFGVSSSKCLCQPVGKFTAVVMGDCNDSTILVNPGYHEICDNSVDDDCDGMQNDPTAEGCTLYYYDGDGDGFGLTGDSLCLCEETGGYTALSGTDCNDTAFSVNPGAIEICGDGIDNNCDGTQNDEDAIGCVYWYADGDADGYGNPKDPKCLCAGFGKYTTNLLADCNDVIASINPGAAEVCGDLLDNDCDGDTDEDC